ncbi:MAG: precorrin-6y C5,15-methyltransferase (decarboxylating) subunit CbiE [Muribaculaceae bacterium]|nr:precorrin-6y C5,15-methyltransferase (decarboxylating) subunit CbiE [Muribaculaceae bacterium]
MSEQHFIVIGISDSHNQFFSPEVRRIIMCGKVFSGGKRHHQIVESLLPPGAEWIDVTVPLEKVFIRYASLPDVVVFASGDPLFYGYATTLQREFPTARITVYPSFNSLQLLAHRLLLPYNEMISVSVTGRPWKNLDTALIENRSVIGVLTDKKKTPAAIAQRLLYYGYDNYIMHVGECLGNETERVRTMALSEATEKDFDSPNCVILQMTEQRQRFFGIPENQFAHLEGRSNMITKMPVRLVSLSMLDLYNRTIMWDIGYCTGSVSIEARLQFPHLEIISFERREESKHLLEENCRRFGAPGIKGVTADFMTCDLSGYPAPEAVFIGGHGGRLDEMVERIYTVLCPGGVIVFNSVSADSCQTFIEAVGRCGGSVVATHILKVDAHNSITILKAV